MCWKQGNPGGPCCGCVDDGLGFTVCVCDCLTPYTRAASLGDENGTHAFPYNPGQHIWIVSYKALRPTWRVNTFGGACVSLGDNLATVNYNLAPNCTDQTWVFTISYQIVDCDDPDTGLHVRRPANDSLSGPLEFYTVTIPMDCDNTSMLAFDVPTDHPDGYPMPGGGGTLAVVF